MEKKVQSDNVKKKLNKFNFRDDLMGNSILSRYSWNPHANGGVAMSRLTKGRGSRSVDR